MSNRADIFNSGFRQRSAYASYGVATAGGAGDNVQVAGPWVSRRFSDVGVAKSAKLVIAYRAVLAQGATLSLAVDMREATSNAGAAAAVINKTLAATVVATGGTGGSTEVGTIELDYDLSSAEEFVQSRITPDLSAANTDTCTVMATWVFGGTPRNPASKSPV